MRERESVSEKERYQDIGARLDGLGVVLGDRLDGFVVDVRHQARLRVAPFSTVLDPRIATAEESEAARRRARIQGS